VLVLGLITGILLYIVGSILERHELAQREAEAKRRRAEFAKKWPNHVKYLD